MKSELSKSCCIHLDSVVKDLKDLRGSTPEAARPLPLVELFVEEVKFLRYGGVRPSSVVPLLMGKLGMPQEGPLGKAGLLISLKAEEATNEPDYHNQHHTVEVVVAAYILGQREKLPVYRTAELIIAAAAHDLGHTGRTNQFDYEREALSFQIAQPLLEQARLMPSSIQRIEQMILATDFRVGVPPARQAYLDARSLPSSDDKRLLATQCQLLTEADVLFSCFDLDSNEFLSRLLTAEWKRTEENLSMVERMKFLSLAKFISTAATELGLETRRQNVLSLLRSQSTIRRIVKPVKEG